MSARPDLTRCENVAPLLVFYACDEVSADECERIDTHLASCAACKKQLSEEVSMQAAFTGVSQCADQLDSSGTLLSQCRSELSEMLDDLSAPPLRERWMPFGWLRRCMAIRPAWSAAGLILVGLAVGTQASLWFSARDGGDTSAAGIGAMKVMAVPRLSDEDLSKMAVAGVNFASSSGSAPGTLQLQVRTEQPLMVVGNVDDADVRRVLTYVVANGERFDPGVRLDCLDGLRARTGDAEVRRALLAAARKDQNPAVRMKALELLRDSAGEDAVRDALLDALQHDANPGVRVEAVNMLVRSLEDGTLNGPDVSEPPAPPGAATLPGDPSFEHVVHALEELQRSDPNRYVRLRSAAALRQIGPRDLQ
jgi:hypothetical protein